jgi:hypothetical protein
VFPFPLLFSRLNRRRLTEYATCGQHFDPLCNAPITAHTDMITTIDVYSFSGFLLDYWCSKLEKIKIEVRRTVSRTSPIQRVEREIYIFQDGGQV